MKKGIYKVMSYRPVCIDFPSGESKNLLKGTTFHCDPRQRSVVRALRTGAIRQVSDREALHYQRIAEAQRAAARPAPAPAPAAASRPSLPPAPPSPPLAPSDDE